MILGSIKAEKLQLSNGYCFVKFYAVVDKIEVKIRYIFFDDFGSDKIGSMINFVTKFHITKLPIAQYYY